MMIYKRRQTLAAILAVFLFGNGENFGAVVGGPGGQGGWNPSQISGQGIVVKPNANTLEVRTIANGDGILWTNADGVLGNPSARVNINTNDLAFNGGILSLNSNRTEQVRGFTNIIYQWFFQTNGPATPNPGSTALYTKSDGNIYKMSSDGVEMLVGPGGGGGGGATSSDAVYNSTNWNGSLLVPTQNSTRDQFEFMLTNGVQSSSLFGNDERVLRSDGTAKNIQSSLVSLDDSGRFTFPVGVRQTFAPSTINSGINVGSINATEPSSPQNGDIWYYGTGSGFRAYAGNVSFAINSIESRELPLNQWKAGSPAAVFSAAEETDRWLFNDSTDQFIVTQFPPGHSFNGAAWSMTIWFAMTTATSGNVIFGAQVMNCMASSTEDSNANGYAAATLSTATAAPTTVGAVSSFTVQLTNLDGLNSNANLIKIRLFRDADNAADTATGDAELLGMRMTWRRANN